MRRISLKESQSTLTSVADPCIRGMRIRVTDILDLFEQPHCRTNTDEMPIWK
jgi:hypothetical protein